MDLWADTTMRRKVEVKKVRYWLGKAVNNIKRFTNNQSEALIYTKPGSFILRQKINYIELSQKNKGVWEENMSKYEYTNMSLKFIRNDDLAAKSNAGSQM